MSDAVDLMRAMKEREKQDRADAWANRAEAFAQIEALGFVVVVMDHSSRHCRVTVKGHGWFDFWPSTGRWAESPRQGGQRGRRGHDLDGLLSALEGLRR